MVYTEISFVKPEIRKLDEDLERKCADLFPLTHLNDFYLTVKDNRYFVSCYRISNSDEILIKSDLGNIRLLGVTTPSRSRNGETLREILLRTEYIDRYSPFPIEVKFVIEEAMEEICDKSTFKNN